MPRRNDLKSILIIGAGPIVIGQACEFDYSGTQAVRALKEEGYRTILVNSNPATIMTDPDLADRTYIEPLSVDYLEAIIERESPDAILPTVGGQTALNLVMELHQAGILEREGVALIGASIQAIETAEDREKFKAAMDAVGLDTPKGGFVKTRREALQFVQSLVFPIIIRPSFTMGGTGGSTAYNAEELSVQVERGLHESPIGEVLLEEYLAGWKEYELEVIRDQADNVIIICSIENIDPMGVHTGDSVTVAPAMTLTDREYQRMRNAAMLCIRTIGVETGGSNVQFAVHPETGRMVIIEMNPRVSRSSALASKATGFPIAKVAAKLAVGYTLDELPNDITGRTLAAFEPTIDYIVTKVPRFDFEKFPSATGHLGVQMQSVGEVMALGRTFQESLQKAFRALEVGLDGLEPRAIESDGAAPRSRPLDMTKLRFPTAFRLLKVRQAFIEGMTLDEVYRLTAIDRWFLREIHELAMIESQAADPAQIGMLKSMGFSDRQLARRFGMPATKFRQYRKEQGVAPVYKAVDTCAAEFEAQTPYCYSSYDSENEIAPLEGKKVMILGGGPNRIGQGLEFDYCCVQAVFGLQEQGCKSIMVNCNPETVSTDFDMVDRLYFEPVTVEDVMNIIDLEQPDGVLVQFGGQTPLKLAGELQAAGAILIGTSPESIDLAEDREKFGRLLDRLQITRPNYGLGSTPEEVAVAAGAVGYPVLVRPSYVLGGRAMEIIYSAEQLADYFRRNPYVTEGHPVFLDQFLEDAFEFDVDALCDGESVYIGGVMQHIEEAGIHSGDSACVLPPYQIEPAALAEIIATTKTLALELQVVGLINLQFAYKDDTVYVLEVNPRASRTVPFVSKTTGVPLAKIAAQLAVGARLGDFKLPAWNSHKHIAMKEVVLPFNKFPEEGAYLGPEMRSTGEAMGLALTQGGAYRRAILGSGTDLANHGTIFISVNDRDKRGAISIARDFIQLGFDIVSTTGTARAFAREGLAVRTVFKVNEGRPDVVDGIKNGEIVMVINTPLGKRSRFDEQAMGRAAISKRIPFTTTLSGARAAVKALQYGPARKVRTLQEYHSAAAEMMPDKIRSRSPESPRSE